MRLRRLHLTRYGGFSDAVLDLPRPDGPDVTLVLGPNEAGKSTAFSAWLDVLFGIAKRNPPAAWRFPRSELDIAVDIETSAGAQHLRRLTVNRDALSDADGSPVPEGEVAALLHGLSREGYRTRFSLDREMLDEGGKDIAGGKGDLGNLLFAGMAGLPGIQAALEETKAAADEFHRLGGRRTKSSELGAGLAELKEADAALAARLTPEVQARHDAAVAETEADQEAAVKALAAARRATACERDAIALRGIDARIVELDAQLTALPRCTWSPAEAEAARAALTEAERTEAAREKDEAALECAEADLKKLAATPGEGVAGMVLDALTAMQVEGAPVIDRLGPVNDGDLARNTGRRELTAKTIAEERARFELDGPAMGLADRIEPVLRAVGDAEAEAQRTRRAAEAAAKTLEALPRPADMGDTTALRDALDTLRGLDLPALRRDRDAAAEALERLVVTGAVPDDLPDPAQLQAEIARHRDAATAHATALHAEEEARVALGTRTRLAEAARAAAVGADAGAVEAARQARDAAWQVLRAKLDAASADSFETAMKTHDRLVAGLADAATRAETARTAEEALAQAEADHDARVAMTARAGTALAARDLGPFAGRLGLPSDAPPDAFQPRLETLREAARAAPKAARAETALAKAEATRDQVLDRLRSLLPDTLDPENAARARLRDAEGTAEAKGRYASAETALGHARSAEADAAAALAEAQRRLAQERAAAGLGPLSLADLPALRALASAEAKDAEDARRQSALLKAREAAAPELARLAELGDPGPDPIAFARTRATADRDAVQRRATATEKRDEALACLTTAKGEEARAAARLREFLRDQGGEGPSAQRVAALSKATSLRGQREAASREAEGIARRHDPEALAKARALPPDPARVATLEDAETAAEAHQRTAIAAAHDTRRVRDEAQGGETAALAVQARAAVLSDLGEGALRAAAAIVGHMAGSAALARLVQDNRGPMVATASAAFHRITGGEWEGLEVFGPDGMTLMAQSGDRRAPVESLSEGARAQLFLSLRVAGHATFCERHGPLPFVTDDILEAFDNTRARAALRMAAEMGDRGQVIFFTHHEHIAALAQDAIPRVAIVEMPRQGG